MLKSSDLASYPHNCAGHHGYGKNLAYAARAFLAALVAARPAKPFPAVVATAEQSSRDRKNTISELNRLADRFDSTMPNQAAELRFLAAHC